MASNHHFSFRTTYENDDTLYWAHLIDGAYHVSVERNALDCTIEFSLDEAFSKVQQGEWQILEKF
jgi:hypothetical protein